MGLEVRNAMARGDTKRLAELRGTKVEIQNGRFMESRDGGASWYDMNTGTTGGIIDLKEQADTAALAAGIRQANMSGYPAAQQQAAGVAAGIAPADTSSGDAIRFGRAARPGTSPTTPATPSVPMRTGSSGSWADAYPVAGNIPPQYIINPRTGLTEPNPAYEEYMNNLNGASLPMVP
jgi:hypothetical protein